ncbi:hypothetical protein MVEN_01880900 [Mycena venus]|uniref:CxC2-like cysteine cluster KDZ transposase-associated domain-containing protein n=1 Tax=Mycena venus TaxID=2733690 RepID=A0A8H6XHS0_9AGAR|nr:hypothetical protein MVEN_01880900 [Mycena venus]
MRFSDAEVGLICDNALPEPAKAPFPVPRPTQLLAKTPAQRAEPLVYCANGQALSQRLARPAKTPRTPARQGSASPYVLEYYPSQSPTKPGPAGPSLNQKQWKRWTHDVIPKLVPVFLHLWYKTESLRDTAGLELPTRRQCACKLRTLDIAMVRMTNIHHVRIRVCACQTAAEQLLTAGFFPCSPQRPSLAVDIGVLEFVRQLFLALPPNNTAFCNTLEGFLASWGYKLTTKDTLHVHFANALEWYTTLRNTVSVEVEKLMNAARNIFRGDEICTDTDTPTTPSAVSSGPNADPSTSATCASAPATPDIGGTTPGRSSKQRRADVSDEGGGQHRGCTQSIPGPTTPRCPACFGGLEHDPSQQVDIEVCLDTCFTQKRRRKNGGRDPVCTHPETHFVAEETAQKMDKHVENLRPKASKPKPKQVRVEEEEADGYKGGMKVPRSAERFFDDTGVMALLCRHDRVLWLVNMRMPGEKQYYALSLLETLFQHLPANIWVGVLYDIACQLHRSCVKFGFLGRYLHRILFAVVVDLVLPTEKDANTCGNPSLATSANQLDIQYHHRLHTIDSQIDHADKASLGRLGMWLVRRKVHCDGKLREAREELAACGVAEAVLREEWKKQVAAQTKPAPQRSKTRGITAIEEVIATRKRVDALFQKMMVLQEALVDPKSTPHVLLYAESHVDGARAAWKNEQEKLQRLQAQLGVTDATALQKLRHSDYYAARMNAKILKEWLRQRLRERKFELDLIKRSFRRTRSENQRNEHAGAAIKRREPTITSTVKQYNKLCADIATLIKAKKAPADAVALTPIPTKEIYQLDVDDAIWQDIGLDQDTEPVLWLSDNNVRSGIRAMLQKDRCGEEAPRLLRKRRHMQIWFATEWKAVCETIELSEGAVRYQFELKHKELLELCVLWKKSLDSLSSGADLPPWGPTDEEILDCQISGITASYASGEESEDDGEWDNGETAGTEEEEEEEDDLLYVLETVEQTDTYRRRGDVEEVEWVSDDEDDVFT